MTAPPQRRGIAAAVGAVILALVVGLTPAGAQIEDRREEAAALAAKLADQARDIVALDKEHRRARDALAVADSAVTRAVEELELADRRQADARRLLAVHAQLAYVGGGSVSFIGHMAKATVDDAGARRAYLQIVSGEDRLAIGRLRAAQEDLQARRESVERARATAAGRAQATGTDKARLEQAIGAQRALVDKANRDLAGLVAAEQARRDAEAGRLAVASAPATTAPPVPAPAAPGSPAVTTTTTAAPAPVTRGAMSSSSSVDETFACIRQLESGNNYSSPGGGAYQFQDATWQSLGYKGSAQDAPPAVQDEAARKLLARDGWRPWTTAPLCGRV